MKLEKLITIAATVLLVAMVGRIGYRYYDKPGPRKITAVWHDRTLDSAASTAKIADDVVMGHVMKVRRADDLVGIIPGSSEPDRIAVEVVTVKVDKQYKGKPETIELFHTGDSSQPSPADRKDPPQNQQPPKPSPSEAFPGGGTDRPAGGRDNSADPTEARLLELDDDPGYKVGEKYVLFVRKGPQLKTQGATIDTMAATNPEGRFRVRGDNKLDAMTPLGYAGKLHGKDLKELEAQIPRP